MVYQHKPLNGDEYEAELLEKTKTISRLEAEIKSLREHVALLEKIEQENQKWKDIPED